MAPDYEASNRREYADAYDAMKWLTPEAAVSSATTRQSLLDVIFGFPDAHWAFAKTKPFIHALSPGCQLCGQGQWSCLFINGICNARCFYCPTSQNDAGQPMTNSIVFERPRDYADYLNRFDIRGVSFSGGEPFMTFDKVLSFMDTLKAEVDHPLYIWMYTNGRLVTKEKLAALRERGLDEIRFDLSANEYRLDYLEKALGVIPHVTVEVPAIPEDLPKTKKLIAELEKMGVNFLNLHQIRCTPYNREKLAERGYTFLHGPKVTVLETELAALKLMRHALENAIALPINYCSFTYRNQFQSQGARRRGADIVKTGFEDITETGFIRRLTLVGQKEAIAEIGDTLAMNTVDPAFYSLSTNREQLSFSAGLWPLIDFSRVRLKVVYHQAVLREQVSYRHSFKKAILDGGKSIIVEKQAQSREIWFEGAGIHDFGDLLSAACGKDLPSGDKDHTFPQSLSDVLPHEIIREGLFPYC